MLSFDHPLLSQAAALLCTLLTHLRPDSCPRAEMETLLHQLSEEVARRAAQQQAQAQVAAAEENAPECACGTRLHAEQRRGRSVLLPFGLLQLRWWRYRCPACGTWCCPAAERLAQAPQQRMTEAVQESVSQFGLCWSYQVAAVLLARVLPGAVVSAKTVERVTKR